MNYLLTSIIFKCCCYIAVNICLIEITSSYNYLVLLPISTLFSLCVHHNALSLDLVKGTISDLSLNLSLFVSAVLVENKVVSGLLVMYITDWLTID